MTVVNKAVARVAKRWTLLPLVALVFSSCMPIAPWQPAEGGPNPPLAESPPLPDRETIIAQASPTALPDIETEASATPAASASAPTATATPEPVVAAVAISMQAALNCLASGQVVYGLALQNTNVRQETDVAACRIGRIPKGSLVRITGSLDDDNPLANVALVTATPMPTAETDEPEVDGELVVSSTVESANGAIEAMAVSVSSASEGAPVAASPADRALNAIFGRGSATAAESSVVSAVDPNATASGDSSTIALLPTVTPTPSPTASPTEPPTATPVEAATATPAPTIPALPAIGYAEDIQPLFNRVCNSCHSGIVKSNDLQVTEYEPLMAGGKSGPPVIPGESESSLLWHQIETGVMPMVGELNDIDKALVRDWIDAGAPEHRPTPVPTATPVATATSVPTFTPTASTGSNEDQNGADASEEEEDSSAPSPTPTPGVMVQLPQQSSQGNWDFASAAVDGAVESAGPSPFAAADAMWGEWLAVDPEDFDAVAESCQEMGTTPLSVVSSELILPVACGIAPSTASLDLLRVSLALPVSTPAVAAVQVVNGDPAGDTASATTAGVDATIAEVVAAEDVAAADGAASAEIDAPVEAVGAAPAASAATGEFSASAAGISARAIGLAAPADADGWLTPRGGYCIDRQLPDNDRSITALAFAPDGRLYIGFDSKLTGDVDPLILNDAFHPSRSIAVYDPSNGNRPEIILNESPRVTGLDYDNGILWVSRSGEVGMIRDGGAYEPLAGGFAVDSHLYHANNGIVATGGYVYVSAGGVRDGYYEGPILGISEQGAQEIVSGGNPWAARIVRAPIDQLLSTRSINSFTTAARGIRNPYGITVDPAGRLWWTDNGATNVPDGVLAGDEVDMLLPANAGNGDGNAPFYGFPLAIMEPQPWFEQPVVNLVNTAAPTGITWAMGTIFFAQYGRDPGLYRLGESNGTVVAERVLLGWPILAVTTAPDGALWIGMGDGGLYRITGGCNN